MHVLKGSQRSRSHSRVLQASLLHHTYHCISYSDGCCLGTVQYTVARVHEEALICLDKKAKV